jgi:uridylate kinase
MKATRVDGVYDKDPIENPDAKLFGELTYMDVIKQDLKVMDATSITLCRDNKLPIVVFNITDPANIFKAVTGDRIGTIVS